tara:strand:- start:1264 stop:1809 length:546 start_codon:yes stop_codon:yes gene_type:complete
MIIEKTDTRIFEFLKYMQHVDKTRSPDDYWYTNPDLDRYKVWSIVEHNNKIVACSAVQHYKNVARILTRFCIDPNYRTIGAQQNKYIDNKTFAFQMVEEQLEYCKLQKYDHAFFSTEHNRTGIIKRHIRIATSLGFNCKLLTEKYNTCQLNNGNINLDPICWQNIGLYSLSDKEFPLEKLL